MNLKDHLIDFRIRTFPVTSTVDRLRDQTLRYSRNSLHHRRVGFNVICFQENTVLSIA